MAIPKKGAAKKKLLTKKKTLDKKKAAPKKAAARKNANYLTKRILISAAKTGFTTAAAATMQAMGFNVILRNGWIVKKYADGRVEKIKKLEATKTKKALALD